MAVASHVLATLFASAAIAQLAALVPAPIPGSRLIHTSQVDGPLEVRSATADEEAILAGLSYTRTIYEAPANILAATLIATYRDALFASGWKLIAVPKVDAAAPPPDGIVSIAAHFHNNGRNIYLRISRSPDNTYAMNVADVGDEDWSAPLVKQCHLTIHSLHFELDRPALRLFESEPTLEKLAAVLKSKNAPAVEIQGHMDNIGDGGVAERQALSEARAKTVAAWLTSHGVPAARVTAKGYGKTKPIADNDTDLGRALNRRIEVACLRH